MYSLKITTWENDGDNYSTHEIRSEDRGYIKFLIEIASLFYSKHSHYNDDKVYFGNADSALSGEIYKAIDSLVHKYVRENVDVQDWLNGLECHDWYWDLLYDEVGISTWNDGEYWRVFESFKVEILPSDVRDVAEEFKSELKEK